MEAGLEPAMPTYSGGLGVLAGDTLRASADLGLSLVGMTLLYRQGFFRQHLDASGHQTETSYDWDPAAFLEPVEARTTIVIEGRDVTVGAWVYHVRGAAGDTVPVYLLDTDLPENDPADRALTGQLYGGDQSYRLRQEVVLGLGGMGMLRVLGYQDIETYHLNEGHCALLTLALLDEATTARLRAESSPEVEPPFDDEGPSPDDIDAVRRRCVFTTHTPVPAGHDRFPPDLVAQVLGEKWMRLIERQTFYRGDVLNMTYLALAFCGSVNAVAQRHSEIASIMYPEYRVYSITNGVHARTWTSDAFAALYDAKLPRWRFDSHYLRQAITLPLDAVREAHTAAKRALFAAIEARTGVRLDPAVMTIGFARRAATYKRSDLVFSDLDRLKSIIRDVGTLQFVFAGKAHPADDPGKAMIQRVFEAREELTDALPVVYLEEHDMALGRLLCAGVDLWLNTPQKPQEASGTSGMKAALNGVPSLSVLDGWWPEGWIEGVTGWSIGDDVTSESDPRLEAETIYSKLRHIIVPLYYGPPQGYARVMRSTIAVNGAYFTAQRMVQQYVENAYRPREESS